MKRIQVAVLLGFCICVAQAAEPPTESEIASVFKVFRGQWNFMQGSTTWCAEQVPATKREFERARDHAETQMARAEAVVADDTGGNREGYKPLIEMYTSGWIKYAAELVAGIKRQDPRKACPDLLANWQVADIDTILDDWRGFLERNGPVPSMKPAPEALHGAK